MRYAWRIRRMLGIWAIAMLAPGFTGAALGRGAGATQSAATGAKLVNPAATCGVAPSDLPTDRLRVMGRRLEDSHGRVIVPEGISDVGGPEQHSYLAAERSTDAQIDAAAAAWHVNSQRLQVSQSNLLSHPSAGYGYNRTFAAYLNRLICRILGYHEIPIVNVNTWFTGNQPNPTAMTVKFWDYMSVNYRRWPVIFDLFNEPRLKRNKQGRALNGPRIWRLWKSGGRVSGVRYVGMQQLVNEIRIKDRDRNVIWIESAYETSQTAALPGHLLSGRNLMYSFHKLHLDTPSNWYAVGRLAQRGLALVDGEWTLFAAIHRPWECYPGGYTYAPAYLAYWKSLGVGIEAWSLQYGALVHSPAGQVVHDGDYTGFPTDPGPLEIPNTLSSSFGCDTASLGQGAGTLVMNYFKQNSVSAPRALFAAGS